MRITGTPDLMVLFKLSILTAASPVVTLLVQSFRTSRSRVYVLPPTDVHSKVTLPPSQIIWQVFQPRYVSKLCSVIANPVLLVKIQFNIYYRTWKRTVERPQTFKAWR